MQGGHICCNATDRTGFSRDNWLELILFLGGNNDTSTFFSQELIISLGIAKHGVVNWHV